MAFDCFFKGDRQVYEFMVVFDGSSFCVFEGRGRVDEVSGQ